MLTDIHPYSDAGPKPLPEALGANGPVLLAGDATAAFLTIAILGLVHGAAPAFLVCAATLLIAMAIGRYRLSFALTTRDALYETAAPAILGTPIGLLTSAALGFTWWAAITAAILWLIAAAAISITLQAGRRGPQRFSPVCADYAHLRPGLAKSVALGVIRCCDVVFSSLAIVIALPLLAVTALLIAVRDGLPVLFQQRRVGRDENDFMLLKFRTMRAGASTDWAVPGDARITPLGAVLRRTSLDELPQLFNIFAGSMSLVGPRPEMREYADRFALHLRGYSWRHVVRPGLTGWAQVHLPRNLRPEDAPNVLDYDLFYVENLCVYLYAFLLVKTACELSRHNAV